MESSVNPMAVSRIQTRSFRDVLPILQNRIQRYGTAKVKMDKGRAARLDRKQKGQREATISSAALWLKSRLDIMCS